MIYSLAVNRDRKRSCPQPRYSTTKRLCADLTLPHPRLTPPLSPEPTLASPASAGAQPDYHFLHRNMSLRNDDSLIMTSRQFLDAFCPLAPKDELAHSAYQQLPLVFPTQIQTPPSLPAECPHSNFVM